MRFVHRETTNNLDKELRVCRRGLRLINADLQTGQILLALILVGLYTVPDEKLLTKPTWNTRRVRDKLVEMLDVMMDRERLFFTCL